MVAQQNRSVRWTTMTRSKQIGNHKSDKKKNISKLWKTKRRVKDIDQIHEDLLLENAHRLLNQEIDYSLPGNAQHYCIHCARYFVDLKTLKEHFKTKVHKRRLKQLKEEPYTQEEAERAAGMGSYKPPKHIEVQTQEMPME
ncbi:zinc finger protein 593 [Phyllobates terribilis]|uniref:zinc finger protein 593 n=1 Tax=Phyllobates terribilis TaxID=111132 RepID=UPI003CCADC43